MSTIESEIKDQGPVGLGGWLILPALGLIISPFILYSALAEFYPMLRDGSWRVLTTPGSTAYHPLWQVVIPLDLLASVILLVLDLWLLFLFFSKSPKFPRTYIAFLLINVIFTVALYFLMTAIPSVSGSVGDKMLPELIRAFVMAAIWIPYFFVSKRVKNTFFKKKVEPHVSV